MLLVLLVKVSDVQAYSVPEIPASCRVVSVLGSAQAKERTKVLKEWNRHREI